MHNMVVRRGHWARCAIAVVVSVLVPCVARAALTSVEPATAYIVDRENIFEAVPGGEFEATYADAGALLNFQGTGNFYPQGIHFPILRSVVRVTPGPLPVEITPHVQWDYKLINGGGTFEAPTTTIQVEMLLNDAGTFDQSDPQTPGLGASIYHYQSPPLELTGNGYTFDVGSANLPSYILAAKREYILQLGYDFLIDAEGLGPHDPLSTQTLEGGLAGLDFDGLSVSLNPATLPEPSSFALLLGGAAMSLFVRRRRAR